MKKYEPYQLKDPVLVYLVGKTVSKLEMNNAKDVIRFTLDDGAFIFASAVGECCSRSWFEHIEGEDALIGSPVLAVVEKKSAPDYGELTQFYGWTLETARGRFDIEMRNESNGYYGGKIIVSDSISDQHHSEVEDEFVPATAGEK